MTGLTLDGKTGTASQLLPRVNLLPPEIAERATFRRIQGGLGGGVLAAVAVVALLYVSAAGSVSKAETEKSTATQQQTSLQAETAKYSSVTATYAQAAAAQQQLSSAMGDEVRYSQLLNDLSLSVPSNVWLKSLAFAQQAPVAATPATPAAAAVGGTTPIGSLTVTGIGFSHDDVAVWLESLATVKTYQDPYFSVSTESLLGSRKTVSFTSTTTLLSTALSHRYDKNGS